MVFYSYESDLGDGWEDPDVHDDAAGGAGAGAADGREPGAVRARAGGLVSPGAGDLTRRVAAVRRHLRRRSALAAGTWVAVGVAGVWVAAWILAGASGWRAGSVLPLVLDLGLVAWLGLGAFAAHRLVDRWLAEDRLAGSIERAALLRTGEVRGPLELARGLPEGVSSALAERASERAAARLHGRPDRELAGEMGLSVALWTRRGWGALLGATLVLVMLAVLAPTRSAGAFAGLASPIGVLRGAGLPALVVEPGSMEVMRGADVDIEVRAEGRRTVRLRSQETGDVARSEEVEVVDGRAVFLLRDVSAPTEYVVDGDDGSSSPRYVLTPVDPLFVSDLRIDVTFPPHTGFAPEQYQGATPILRVPVGTRFAFEGRANRPLRSVALTDSAGAPVAPLDIEGVGFEGRWSPRSSGTFTWAFRDAQDGRPDVTPEPITVVLIPDEAPAVEIVAPTADTVLAPDLRQALVIEAMDDYGLGTLEMVAYRVTALGERREPVERRFDLGGSRLASLTPVMSFESWGLLPGDQVRYFVRVVDNGPSPQSAQTAEYVLRMPSADQIRRGVDEALTQTAERLSELAEEAGLRADENRQQARERTLGQRQRQPAGAPTTGGDPSFEERQGLERALSEQEEMAATLDSLSAELGAMEQRMAEAGQADPELRPQMRELRSLLDQLEGEELRAETERLSEALERNDLREAGRTLEQLAAEQEELRERLEESLDRFRRAAVEQDFRATRTEAEELARQERALADAMREEDTGALRQEQQEQLSERAEELESRLDRLEERLRSLGEERAADGVRDAAANAEQAAGDMREAAQQAGQGRPEDAAQRAEQASDRLDEAARALQQAQQDEAQQQLAQAREALERSADDALALARRQAELRRDMREAGRERIAEMRAEEASLAEGVENLADNLRLATEGQIPGAREMSAQMGRAMESLQRTIDAMDRPRSMGGSPYAEAERAVGDLNQLALMALAGAEQLGQQGQGQTQQGQQIQDALEELAQQQGDLVNQAGQIVPMQLGQQAMSEQLQRMSQGQQSVSDQLGDLSNQPSSDGALGDLQQLAAEAAELAEALAAGRLEPETVRRQERLFHRLLDAGRSLEREEFSEERESEAAGEFERGSVLPLEGGQLGALQFRMPDAAQLEGLSPGVRRLILEYFERLNRGSTVGGGAR